MMHFSNENEMKPPVVPLLFQATISSPQNLKLFATTFQFLSKISQSVILEIDTNFLKLRAVNDSKTAFAFIPLDKENYFETFEFTSEVIFTCKMPVKPIAHIFRNLRKIISIDISIDNSNEYKHEIIFDLLIENSVKKQFQFFYQDSEVLSAIFNEDSISQIIADPKVFVHLFEHIRHSLEAVIEVSSDDFRIKSYHQRTTNQTTTNINTTGDSSHNNKNRYMTSDIGTPLEAFDSFHFHNSNNNNNINNINNDIEKVENNNLREELIFCVKEIRALLAVSEVIESAELVFMFTTAGAPIQFKLKHHYYEIILILATLTTTSTIAIEEEDQQYQQQQHYEQQPQQQTQPRQSSFDESEEGKHQEYNEQDEPIIIEKRRKHINTNVKSSAQSSSSSTTTTTVRMTSSNSKNHERKQSISKKKNRGDDDDLAIFTTNKQTGVQRSVLEEVGLPPVEKKRRKTFLDSSDDDE